MRLRRRDLWWLLCTPVYVHVSSFIHEGSHAAGLQYVDGLGAGIRGGILGWYVTVAERGGTPSTATMAAPYVVDAIIFTVAFLLLNSRLLHARWLRLNVLIVGMLSPAVDTGVNWAGAWVPHTDFRVLWHRLGAAVLVVTGLLLIAYTIAIWRELRSPHPGGAGVREATDAWHG